VNYKKKYLRLWTTKRKIFLGIGKEKRLKLLEVPCKTLDKDDDDEEDDEEDEEDDDDVLSLLL
jgi:hypothetical protein